ncbi:MAG: FG-GAP-like repeat-containing protein [Phycisphaerae bacterium]|nr:FG-GAP-like repeat-containing protein [Phycisphaerae bacterium]
MRRPNTQWIHLFTAAATLGTSASFALAGGWVEYVNQTSTRLVAAPGLGASDPEEKDLAYDDFDQDGDIDLIVVRKQPFTTPTGKRNVLFMNEGGVLVDRTIEFATSATDGGQGFLDITNDRDVAIADFDNDGWLDFVTCPALNQSLPKTISHPRIYMNRGNDDNGNWLGFRYEEPRIPQLPTAPNGCGIAAGDVTGDGFADIYLVNYNSSQGDRLLINNGSGFFADETLARMTPQMIASGFGTSGAILDMNGDGVNDVIKSENGPFKASYNKLSQVGIFDKHETVSGGAHYGMSAGDLNNDGKVDVVLGDDGSDRYLINTGPGPDGMANFLSSTFSFQSGGDDGFGNNSRIVDLNNDGFNDVLIADVDVDIGGCSRRLHLYRNLGNVPNVTLQDQGTGGIPASELTGTHDVAVFDLDGDGWKDLIIGRCAGLKVWMAVPPVGLVVNYPSGLPGFVAPNLPTTFAVGLTAFGGGTVVEGSGLLHYILPSGTEQTAPLTLNGGTLEATLPGVPCTESISWWVSAQISPGNGTFTDPPTAPLTTYTSLSAVGTEVTLREEFEEGPAGWTVTNHASLTGGAWELADPVATLAGGVLASPEDDATSDTGTMCFITQNGVVGGAANASDVDFGPTVLTSPVIDLEGQDGFVTFAAWFFCDDFNAIGADGLTIELSNDDGATWSFVHRIESTNSTWQAQAFRVSDYVEPTATVRVQFSTSDPNNNSITEAGIDNFQIESILCGAACPADFTSDGAVDAADLAVLLGVWGTKGAPGITGDLTGDGFVDGADLAALLGAWGGC